MYVVRGCRVLCAPGRVQGGLISPVARYKRPHSLRESSTHRQHDLSPLTGWGWGGGGGVVVGVGVSLLPGGADLLQGVTPRQPTVIYGDIRRG